ncbi:MAG: hypothetical protein WCD37_11555, partial [Chloroflexia bacterium]
QKPGSIPIHRLPAGCLIAEFILYQHINTSSFQLAKVVATLPDYLPQLVCKQWLCHATVYPIC